LEYRCKHCGAAFAGKRQLIGHAVGKHVKGPRLRNANIRLDGLTDRQIGYIAAFLDGEGGIQITRSTRKDRDYKLALHPCVYFTNTDREAIETLREWLSAGCVVKSKSKGEGYKPTYVLHVTGTRNIASLLALIRPCLIIKARRADTMLRFCDSRLTHYAGNDRRYNEEELSLYTTLKTLNERGVKSNANPRKSN
jgi:LAGLIDADG-like domain